MVTANDGTARRALEFADLAKRANRHRTVPRLAGRELWRDRDRYGQDPRSLFQLALPAGFPAEQSLDRSLGRSDLEEYIRRIFDTARDSAFVARRARARYPNHTVGHHHARYSRQATARSSHYKAAGRAFGDK